MSTEEIVRKASANNPLRSEEGFTLIDGLLAAVVLGLGLLSLASMQVLSLSRNVDANEMTRVTNFAAEIIERIQFNRRNALVYNGIDTNGTCSAISATTQVVARGDCDQWRTLMTSTFANGLTGLRGQVAVTAIGPTAPALNQNRVVVTMNWTGAAGSGKTARARQISIATIVAPE